MKGVSCRIMGKREKLKEFHRSSILAAAGKLFIEKGIAGTTMDDIAMAADYSKSTLYAYFKSKNEIYSCMVLENTVLLKESIEEAIQNHDSVEDTYMAVCWAHVHFQERHPLYFETMLGTITEDEDDTEVNRSIMDVGNEINQILIRFLEDEIGKGRIRHDIDPLQTAFALWAGICGLITMAYNKASYVECMNVSKRSFLAYGFKTYLNAVLQ